MKEIKQKNLVGFIRENVITRKHQKGAVTVINQGDPQVVREGVLNLIRDFIEDNFESSENGNKVAVIVPTYPVSLSHNEPWDGSLTRKRYTLPFHNGYADIIKDSGGVIAKGDFISSDFHICSVVMEIDGVERIIDDLEIYPDDKSRNTITAKIVFDESPDKKHEDILSGLYDPEYGKVYLGSAQGLVTSVQFGGTMNNLTGYRDIDGSKKEVIVDDESLIEHLMNPSETMIDSGKSFTDNVQVSYDPGFEYLPFNMTSLTQKLWDANGSRNTKNIVTIVYVPVDMMSDANYHYSELLKRLVTMGHTHNIIVTDELNPKFVDMPTVSGFRVPTLQINIVKQMVVKSPYSTSETNNNIDPGIMNLGMCTRFISFRENGFVRISDYVPHQSPFGGSENINSNKEINKKIESVVW